MPALRRRRAFTLLELIVVVAVLGVLAAIAVPTFDSVRTESVDRSLTTTADAFVRSIRAIAASDGSGGVVSAAHLASALSELPEGTAHVVTSPSEVVFVLSDRQVVVEVSDGAASASSPSPCAQASGGDDVYDIVLDGVPYRVHVFSTVGVSTFTASCGVEVDYLVVGGGGGGAAHNAGGGGAGGVSLVLRQLIPAGAHAVSVGEGGRGGDSINGAARSGGGGGGAGEPGHAPESTSVGGDGGDGVDMSQFFGTGVGEGGYFGGGGASRSGAELSSGRGRGGGGDGRGSGDNLDAGSGAPATGGGGGGKETNNASGRGSGGDGGSGVVLVRYQVF